MATKKTKKSKKMLVTKAKKNVEKHKVKVPRADKKTTKKNKTQEQVEAAYEHAIDVTVAVAKNTMRPLSAKEQNFVNQYVIDMNGAQAAIRAGYSKHSARQIATRLLTKDYIKAALRDKQFNLLVTSEIQAGRVIQELARIAFSDIRGMVKWNDHNIVLKDSESLTEDQAAAIAEVSHTKEGIKFKTYDKTGALDKLCRNLGMFQENVNLIHKNSIAVDITHFTPEQAAQAYKNALKPSN